MLAEQSTQIVQYDISEAVIATTREKCAFLSADTPQGYEAVRVAIAHLRDTRVAIEKRRVELKADVLAYGRLVDSEAKRFTGLLMDIEEPLKAKKQAVDDEKARVKAEAEAVKLRALEAEIRANQERQEAERRAEREAEEARLAEERERLAAERRKLEEERRQADEAARVEREAAEARMAAERQKLEDERRAVEEQQRVEREAIEAERRAVAAEREKAERAEFERQAKIQAEKDAIEKAERERLEAAQRQARLDALKPDIEKIQAFAVAIRALVPPKPRLKEAKTAVADAITGLAYIAADLERFAGKVA